MDTGSSSRCSVFNTAPCQDAWERQWKLAQGLRSLTPTWEKQKECLDSNSSLVQPGCCAHLGVNHWMQDLRTDSQISYLLEHIFPFFFKRAYRKFLNMYMKKTQQRKQEMTDFINMWVPCAKSLFQILSFGTFFPLSITHLQIHGAGAGTGLLRNSKVLRPMQKKFVISKLKNPNGTNSGSGCVIQEQPFRK